MTVTEKPRNKFAPVHVDIDLAVVRSIAAAGKGIKEVAEHYGTSRSTVSDRLLTQHNTTWAEVRKSATPNCRNGHPPSERNEWGSCLACRRANAALHRLGLVGYTGKSRKARARESAERAERREKARRELYSWQDYADACDREFATPHWLREAPKIKAWLLANKVKP